MDEETEQQGPPQPILIQGNAVIEPSGAPQQVSTALAPPSPATPTTATDGAPSVEEAFAKVRFLEGNKPNTNGLLVMGFFLIFGFPFLLFFITDPNVLYDDIVFVCCFSVIVGVVLIALAETKQAEWKKAVRSAKADVIRMVAAPIEEIKSYRGLTRMGGVLIVVGLFFDLGPLLLVGVLFFVPGLSATMSYDKDIKRAFDRVQEGYEKKGK